MLLDLGLPGMGGITVIEALRGWTDVPIIVLTARDDERSKVLALDAGADDYVTKPFGMAELVARVRAALRRAPNSATTSPSCRPTQFELDLAAHRAFVLADPEHDPERRAIEVRLTPTEWGIVGHLVASSRTNCHLQAADHRGVGARLRARPEPAARAHGTHPPQARSRPARDPQYFITDAGVGYRFQPDS